MKQLPVLLFLLFPFLSQAQLGVGAYHGSTTYESTSFIGIHYEFFDRVKPELRIGTNRSFQYMSIEGDLLVDICDQENYEWYGGLGIRMVGGFDDHTKLAIPVGLNIYPFEHKNFGFHLELTPLLNGRSDDWLRGSWGIRYRFLKE